MLILGRQKLEIRSSKSETNGNDPNSKFQTHQKKGTSAWQSSGLCLFALFHVAEKRAKRQSHLKGCASAFEKLPFGLLPFVSDFEFLPLIRHHQRGTLQ